MRRKDGRPLWINLWMEAGRDRRPDPGLPRDVRGRHGPGPRGGRAGPPPRSRTSTSRRRSSRTTTSSEIVGRAPRCSRVLDKVEPRRADRRRRSSSPARRAPARSWSPARSTPLSRARDGPFVAVNCARAARRAARERAVRPREGRVHRRRRPADRAGSRLADGGTLFLDEIGELPARAPGQAAPRPPGAASSSASAAARPMQVDVRRRRRDQPRPAQTRSQRGRFREDLYYRLNVVPIELPPLRERARGHPACSSQFLVDKFATRDGRRLDGVSRQTHAARSSGLRLAGQRPRAGERHRARRHPRDRRHRRRTSTPGLLPVPATAAAAAGRPSLESWSATTS